jgi:Flp pilus assembly protein TadG
MSREVGRTLKSIFWNETGQMSVFVALIFQVLFVFFAMVINIGLLVHDKINLQNAVDLGAYYAAQRQAEILNEIAHINYQMRQDWKLLVWRYRVLGSMGLPGVKEIIQGGPATESDIDSTDRTQRMCVTSPAWWQYYTANGAKNTDLCQRPLGQQIPFVPQVQIIAPWVPGLGQAAASAAQALQMQLSNYKASGPLNTAFAMYVLGAFKGSIAIRKQEIRALRSMLISQNMLDLEGQRVADGVQKTVERNLTKANLESLSGPVALINGLDHPACSGNGGEVFMPEILTAPILQVLYVDNGNTRIDIHPNLKVDPAFDYGGMLNDMRKGEPENKQADPHFSSLGFEKNPWCMAYVGVVARSNLSRVRLRSLLGGGLAHGISQGGHRSQSDPMATGSMT